ncbi:hypothetical protein BESB_084450 [Besnoitia besnoiti]|uniref:Transmembrane protein n=1 Tax=Besnoitia besnoiti TaxID=94643 RepID=A0A2A9MBE6_BESBE|nr:hypothetical protein BESB_084450 [Besnoitia besnoiti]PFH33246.1 hypothetical protein BESB_084450 [Besnoitia besnoiti]
MYDSYQAFLRWDNARMEQTKTAGVKRSYETSSGFANQPDACPQATANIGICATPIGFFYRCPQDGAAPPSRDALLLGCQVGLKRHSLFKASACVKHKGRFRHRLRDSESTGLSVNQPDDSPVHSSFFRPHSVNRFTLLTPPDERDETSEERKRSTPLYHTGDAQGTPGLEESNPILSAPFPPTSAERFAIGRDLLYGPRKTRNITAPWRREQRCSSAAERGAGVPDEQRFPGPLSFYDDRQLPGPEVMLASPEDVYILDFDHVIHTNTRELVQTAVRAWRRIEKASQACKSGHTRQHAGMSATRGRKLEKAQRSSRSSSNSSTAPRVPLSLLFSSARFDGETPFWFLERARDIRRAVALRGVADFMVAMRHVLDEVVEAETRRGESVDAFVEEKQRVFRAEWNTMDDLERMWLLTREGDMGDVRDVLAFKRGAGGEFPWAVRRLRGWENQDGARRSEVYRRYGVTSEELQEAFDISRREWRANDAATWNEHVKYRSDTRHLDPVDVERLEAYEGFNPAAVCLINNHINSWHRPVHIISAWERSEDLFRILKQIGLKFDHDDARRLLFVYGRDEMEDAAAAQADKQQGGGNQISWKKAALVKSILQKWKPKSDSWRPVHVIDGDVRALLVFARDSELAEAHLYFCEWGHSAIDDKVKAFLASKIKYLKESMQLVKLMGTPADIPARQWTHGFTSCPPEWLEAYKMMPWLRWADLNDKEEVIVQDFAMPPPTTSPITSSISF